MPESALLLLAHGSKAAEADLHFGHLVREVQKTAEIEVARAYLSLGSPSLGEAVGGLVGRGFGHIRILPLFVLPGAHTLGDIPRAVEELAGRHPGLRLDLLPFFGLDPAFPGWIRAAAGLPAPG